MGAVGGVRHRQRVAVEIGVVVQDVDVPGGVLAGRQDVIGGERGGVDQLCSSGGE
jgi:hypothetical protein